MPKVRDIEILVQACAGADLAEQPHDEVERNGAVIRIRGAIRAHAAVKDEIAARTFLSGRW